MTTSDGISTEDWDLVHEFSVDIVNAADDGENEVCRRRLFDYLDHLETKYGPLPSILATRADFMADEDSEKEELLEQAYATAQSKGDHINAVYIAHSLADMYLEQQRVINAGRWVGVLEECLKHPAAPEFSADYARLRAKLEVLIKRIRG